MKVNTFVTPAPDGAELVGDGLGVCVGTADVLGALEVTTGTLEAGRDELEGAELVGALVVGTELLTGALLVGALVEGAGELDGAEVVGAGVVGAGVVGVGVNLSPLTYTARIASKYSP